MAINYKVSYKINGKSVRTGAIQTKVLAVLFVKDMKESVKKYGKKMTEVKYIKQA